MIEYIPHAAAITTVGGAWLTIRKIARDSQKDSKERADEILKSAKEEDALLKAKLEARIETMKAELKNLEFNVNKDLAHLKESYSSEIKVLGEKIEALRSELRDQNASIVGLLAKLIDKN